MGYLKEKEKNRYYDKKPALGQKSSFNIRDHFKQGFSVFVVIVAAIICYFAFLRFSDIYDAFKKIMGLLRPFVYGLVIAYLLNPIMMFIEKYMHPFLAKYIKKEKALVKTTRTIGVFASLVLMITVISALLNMVVPELVKSISDLVVTLPDQITVFVKKIETVQVENTTVNQILKEGVIKGTELLENWVQTDLLKQTNALVSGVTSGVISVVNVVFDIVLGVFVSVYALYGKEEFLAQGRKIIYATMSPKRANLTLHICSKTNSIFGGFIIGKIIDSAIIGVLCFIGVSILKMPYALLVSVFVGVTNVIPYFGPFIGAIPCAILILIVDPLKGLYFIIFIFLLQQLDGNLIGPTILGDSTGLSAFWVLFSILVFGGLFGVVGMIIGVPTFAVFYYVINLFLRHKLEKKNLPVDTELYMKNSYVNDEGVFVLEETSDEKEIMETKGE